MYNTDVKPLFKLKNKRWRESEGEEEGKRGEEEEEVVEENHTR